MISIIDIDKQEHKIPVKDLLEKTKNFDVVPEFHMGVSECLLAGYPLKDIVCIDLNDRIVFYGKEILKTIFYLKNNGKIKSELFPEVNNKKFSEIHPRYKRRIMEHYVVTIEWRCDEENMEYIKQIYSSDEI